MVSLLLPALGWGMASGQGPKYMGFWTSAAGGGVVCSRKAGGQQAAATWSPTDSPGYAPTQPLKRKSSLKSSL